MLDINYLLQMSSPFSAICLLIISKSFVKLGRFLGLSRQQTNNRSSYIEIGQRFGLVKLKSKFYSVLLIRLQFFDLYSYRSPRSSLSMNSIGVKSTPGTRFGS